MVILQTLITASPRSTPSSSSAKEAPTLGRQCPMERFAYATCASICHKRTARIRDHQAMLASSTFTILVRKPSFRPCVMSVGGFRTDQLLPRCVPQTAAKMLPQARVSLEVDEYVARFPVCCSFATLCRVNLLQQSVIQSGYLDQNSPPCQPCHCKKKAQQKRRVADWRKAPPGKSCRPQEGQQGVYHRQDQPCRPQW